LLGRSLGNLIDDFPEEEVHGYYQQILLPERAVHGIDFLTHIGILFDSAEYEYLGGSEHIGEGVDMYEITITPEALNAYWSEIKQQLDFWDERIFDLNFDRDLRILVGILDGKINRGVIQTGVNDMLFTGGFRLYGETACLDKIDMDFSLGDFRAAAVLESNVSDPDVLVSKLTASTEGLELSWDIFWDKKILTNYNLKLEASIAVRESVKVSLDVNGMLHADPTHNQIDARIQTAVLSLDMPLGSLEGSLHGRYLLRSDTEEIVFDEERKPITTINELDLLAMIGKLTSHPMLGEVLSGLLPF
jgi:hypothetical protein